MAHWALNILKWWFAVENWRKMPWNLLPLTQVWRIKRNPGLGLQEKEGRKGEDTNTIWYFFRDCVSSDGIQLMYNEKGEKPHVRLNGWKWVMLVSTQVKKKDWWCLKCLNKHIVNKKNDGLFIHVKNFMCIYFYFLFKVDSTCCYVLGVDLGILLFFFFFFN